MRLSPLATLVLTLSIMGPTLLGGEKVSLLPLEEYFLESPRFAESLSPDGRHVLFLGPDSAQVICLWVLNIDTPGQPRRLSDPLLGSVTNFFWAENDLIWQVAGTSGPRLFVTQFEAGGVRELITGLSGPVSLEGVSSTPHGCVLQLGVSSKQKGFVDLYPYHIRSGGSAALGFDNTQQIIMWAFDGGARPVAGLRWTSDGSKELLDLRDHQTRVVMHTAAGDDLRLVGASKDGTQAIVLTNRGADLNRVERVALTSGKCEILASDPLDRVDVNQVIMDDRDASFIAVSYLDRWMHWIPMCSEFKSMLIATSKDHDLKELTSVSFSHDHQRWLLRYSSSVEPGEVWLYDADTRHTRLMWRDRPSLKRSSLCETQAMTYRARDGSWIAAFLTKPKQGKPPWPLVVFPHGGPHMRTQPGYDGRVQFFASRGYAVLQPNFRGSRGYGKKFMNASDGQWGTGVMQTDITDGVEAVCRKQIATHGRIAIFGGSYGGYASLAGLTFTPDLYAAGVCLFGISDLNNYVSQVPAEWTAYAGDMIRQVGDPATKSGRELLEGRSPISHAKSITAPLLMYHGLKDNLISPLQTRSMVAAMDSLGKRCDYLAAPNEAHGFAKPETEMAVYRAAEIFLHEHIGGRKSDEVSPAVRKRLAELQSTANEDRSGLGSSK